MVFGMFSASLVSVSAADDTMKKLTALAKKFPDGKYWNHPAGTKNNPDSVTSTPCTHHGSCSWDGSCGCNAFNMAIQCMGFAEKASYDITGVNPNNYTDSYNLDVSKLRVGDIIRSSGHSVCVVGVKGDNIAVVHANYDWRCGISWDVYNKSHFHGIEYISHLAGNEMKNTDLAFFDDIFGTSTDVPEAPTEPDEPDVPVEPDEPDEPENPSEKPDEKDEIWQMEDDSNLNIRDSMDAQKGEVIGQIPAGAKFNVYEKKDDGTYLWARVKYGRTEGYSVLNYAKHISGDYETPELEKLKSSYTEGSEISLKWKAVSGANKYAVSLYNENKKLIKEYTSKKNSYTIENIAVGKYYVKITALNSKASSWEADGERESFTVKKFVPLKKLSLKEKASVVAGDTITLDVTFNPSDATNQKVKWSSSDKTVATVDSEGRITALKPGRVTIKCTSEENSKLTAACVVTVKPVTVVAKQVKKGTTVSSIGLKWEKSKGATGYILYRYNESQKKFKKVAELTGTSYTDKKLTSGKSYTYAVKAFVKVGDEKIVSSYEEITAKTVTSAVKNLRQTGADTGRVRIQWDKKANADAYNVYKYNAKTKKFEKIATTKSTVFIDEDKTYTKVYYRVAAIVKTSDGNVRSNVSSKLTAITGLEKPEVEKKQSGTSKVKLSWSKVTGATHYQVFKVVDGKTVLLKTLTADKLSYTDKNLEAGKTYTYYVRSARNHSKDVKLYSDRVEVRLTSINPNSPKSVTF